MIRIALVILLLVLPAACFAQNGENQTTKEEGERQYWNLTIFSEKEVYAEGEKIVVEAAWKNVSDRELTTRKHDFVSANFRILNEKKENITVRISTYGVWDDWPDYKPEYITIEPAEVYKLREEVDPNLVGQVINGSSIFGFLPGVYYIKASGRAGIYDSGRLSNMNPNVESNTIKIRVIPKKE